MNYNKQYYLKNTNHPVGGFKTYENIYFAINDLLMILTESLDILINNNISTNIDNINFDNYEILEFYESNNKNPFIINSYKLNLKTLSIVDINDNSTMLLNKPEFKYITTIILKQFDKLNKNTPTNKKLNRTVNNKNKNPIAKIFEETNGLINKLNNENDKVITKRLIPTLTQTSNDSDNTDQNTEIENENNNDIVNSKINKNDIKVEPDVLRQMDSILYEPDLSIDNMSPENLKKTLDTLQELKQKGTEKLNNLKKVYDDDIKNFSKFCNDLGDVKRELRRNIDREKERRNKFEANKNAYRKIKKDIDDGKLTENKISELFINEYPVYKFMDEKNLLDKDDEYIVYLNLYNELYSGKKNEDNTKQEYIPHNINYLSDKEQMKYKNIKEDRKDIIDEFISKSTTPKKYPSLDEVLNKIDNENLPELTEVNFESV
jgi:hypothetical protein